LPRYGAAFAGDLEVVSPLNVDQLSLDFRSVFFRRYAVWEVSPFSRLLYRDLRKRVAELVFFFIAEIQNPFGVLL
jgi:hypothetical protein